MSGFFGTENRIWISENEIPQQVKNAFIAIEDHRFYSHKGIDPKRTAGAVLSFFRQKQLRWLDDKATADKKI